MIPNGVIVLPPSPTNYISGLTSPIVGVDRQIDWTSYIPIDEGQNFGYETFACVTFAALNCIETQVNYLIYNKLLTPLSIAQIKALGFLDEFGQFSCSDRFTAKLSGTTREGNSMEKVWQTIRHTGLLPQKDWPNKAKNFGEFYQEIPQELKDKALKILDILTIKWEWVVTDSSHALMSIIEAVKHAPVQICTPVCPTWESGDVKACGEKQVSHATMIYEVDNFYYDLDQYEPYRKTLTLDYTIPWAVKGVVTENTDTQNTKISLLRQIIIKLLNWFKPR